MEISNKIPGDLAHVQLLGRTMWNDAAGYERYVGHWSRAIAPRVLAWLALPPGLKWLDVACGTGALTSAILANYNPAEVVGLDASANYLASPKQIAKILGPSSLPATHAPCRFPRQVSTYLSLALP
jgi:cyclopropane fatty-acyl-phospholipid synthase-like methyltransferase